VEDKTVPAHTAFLGTERQRGVQKAGEENKSEDDSFLLAHLHCLVMTILVVFINLEGSH
jgi:hypothetical protein